MVPQARRGPRARRPPLTPTLSPFGEREPCRELHRDEPSGIGVYSRRVTIERPKTIDDPTLVNDDLRPTPESGRTWGTWNIAALWVGMAVCVPSYTLASSLIANGLAWWHALLAVALGNAIVTVPMVLNAHPGTKYGIPFPVLARASFGTVGANVPAVLRALVACGWFGVQTWYGGEAIYKLVKAIHPESLGLPQPIPEWIGVSTGPFIAFLLFWCVNVFFIWRGTESIKWLETLAAPFLIVAGLALLVWAWARTGGAPMLGPGKALEGPGAWASVFFPSLTAMVGFWATLSLNIPDFSRFAKSQRAQIRGQIIGLAPTMSLFAFIGIAVTSATPTLFGVQEPIWNPIDVVSRIGGALMLVVSMLALSIATLSTNIAANVVSPANDFSNLAPGKLSYKGGGYLTAVLGILILPWKLIESSHGYIFTWLIGYSALLGPIAGIMLADYYLIRNRELVVEELYRHDGRYGRWNGAALIALVIGVLPNVPGFLAEASPRYFKDLVPGFFSTVYQYAWFVGLAISMGVY
ncbi:MAG: NCS1 family nucleobase:cation symporter-1, partial [Deltaproteobacteria bacterium]|nr:NCS1 family nucleobase:cation symporter-1 [Deltaproteobacteria bacterium]